LLCLGEALGAAQQWDKSLTAFERYLKEFADSELWFQARFGAAWALENQGRQAEAIGAYREVVSRHKGPTAARAQFQIGECLFAQKRHDDAVRELLKVDILYDYPEWSAAALYEAGRCLTQLDKPDEARRQFQQVTERFKDTEWASLAARQLKDTAAAPPPGSAAGAH
jgi:TolA-binding protein